MATKPRYIARAIRMSRRYFRIGGLILVVLGIGVFLGATAQHGLEAGAMVAVGVGAFLFSFAHPGERVADTAKERLDISADN